MSATVIYTNIPQLLQSCKTIQARIDALDLILNNMETALATAALTGQFEGYKLDTGQTKSEIMYRDLLHLQKAYEALLETQQMLRNRLNYNRTGRKFRLIDGKSIPGYNSGYGF